MCSGSDGGGGCRVTAAALSSLATLTLRLPAALVAHDA